MRQPLPLGLLAAILETPAADVPRLIAADWFDDDGQPERAAFIRAQCRIAALERLCSCGSCVRKRGGGQHTNGPCAVDQERDELPDGRSKSARLRLRQHDLLDASKVCGHPGGKWYPEIFWQAVAPPVEANLEWRRGFPACLTLAAADWLANADQLVWHPEHSHKPCGCRTWNHQVTNRVWDKCPDCKGTGRVPRPMPPTAQPIESVWLTTVPEVYWGRDGNNNATSSLRRTPDTFVIVDNPYPDVVAGLLEEQWPWLTFPSGD